MPAHSFQAPTLIGCQIFKEQGISRSASNLSTSEPKTHYLTAIYKLFLFTSALFPTAEKRDYEGVFIPCQTGPSDYARFPKKINDKNEQHIDSYVVFISIALKTVF